MGRGRIWRRARDVKILCQRIIRQTVTPARNVLVFSCLKNPQKFNFSRESHILHLSKAQEIFGQQMLSAGNENSAQVLRFQNYV